MTAFLPSLPIGLRHKRHVTVRAENSLIPRDDETIAIRWATVRAHPAAAAPTAVRVRDGASGRRSRRKRWTTTATARTGRADLPGRVQPRRIKAFVVETGAPMAKPAKPRVYASHEDPRDDVAWESDRIAYRIYGQGLWKVDSLLSSGVDVWVKRVRDPIVDKWYAKGHDDYHRDTGEGADFFDVGQSLGAGGTGIWRNDKLYRALNFKGWKIIANGPVRAIFELQYQPWDAAGLRVSETKRVAIDAGQNLNHVVSIFRAEGSSSAADIPWVTGIVKRRGRRRVDEQGAVVGVALGVGSASAERRRARRLGTSASYCRASAVADWKETERPLPGGLARAVRRAGPATGSAPAGRPAATSTTCATGGRTSISGRSCPQGSGRLPRTIRSPASWKNPTHDRAAATDRRASRIGHLSGGYIGVGKLRHRRPSGVVGADLFRSLCHVFPHVVVGALRRQLRAYAAPSCA